MAQRKATSQRREEREANTARLRPARRMPRRGADPWEARRGPRTNPSLEGDEREESKEGSKYPDAAPSRAKRRARRGSGEVGATRDWAKGRAARERLLRARERRRIVGEADANETREET